jgi:hypothetical protein
MILVIRYVLTALLIANLTGCAVAYRHPNYEFNSPEDQLNFDKDRLDCESLANRQQCVDLKEKTSMICESNGAGGHDCREVIPKQCTVVTPEQCLRRKGWRKADVNGNYLE